MVLELLHAIEIESQTVFIAFLSPDASSAVEAGRREISAVRAPGNIPHSFGVACVKCAQIRESAVRLDRPDLNFLIAGAGGQNVLLRVSSLRHPGNTPNSVGVRVSFRGPGV